MVLTRLADVPDLERYEAVLAEDEKRRAAAYRVPEAGDIFTLARGLLRHELAKRLRCRAADIAFTVRPSGKPDLRPSDPPLPDWRFSVSHTGPHVALAFALGTDLGIDIERLDRTVNPRFIAKRYFTAEEFAALEARPEEEQSRAFFAVWTRKEAIVKARGGTMAESLTTLTVDLDPEARHPAFHDLESAPARATARLTTFEFEGSKLMGAVAVCSPRPPRLEIEVLSGARFD